MPDPTLPPSRRERTLLMSAEEISAFIDDAFPAVTRPAYGRVVHIAPDHARLVLDPGPETLRPGGIVSGPTLMGLADVAAYAVVLTHIGPVAMAVTTTLTASFLRPCLREPVTADARLLSLGRRMATVDVRLWQGADEREGRLVAQAVVGYALPGAKAG